MNFIDRLLHHYRPNLSRLEIIRVEAENLKNSSDVKNQYFSGAVSSNRGYFDPVGTYVHKLMVLENRIAELERETMPVTQLYCDLQNSTDTMSSYYLLILEEFYFEGKPVSDLLTFTHWSRSKFYSYRRFLLDLAARYFLGDTDSKLAVSPM